MNSEHCRTLRLEPILIPRRYETFVSLLGRNCVVGRLVHVRTCPNSGSDGKQLSKDGLSFNYPNGWTLVDESNADAQNFNIGRADSDAQMRVFVFRTPVTTPERLAVQCCERDQL